MAYNRQIADKFRRALAVSGTIEERQMFGSLGFMVNGKLTICVRETDVMYKVGPDVASQAVTSGGAELVTMHGRTMKAWIFIPNSRIEKAEVFNRFLEIALAFVSANL